MWRNRGPEVANQRCHVRKTKSAKTLVKDIKVVLADQRGCVQKFFGEGERIRWWSEGSSQKKKILKQCWWQDKWKRSLIKLYHAYVSILKTNSLKIQNLTIAWWRCWWCTLYMARNVLSRSRGTHVGSFSSLNHACLFQFTFRTTLISILGVHNSTSAMFWDYL